MIYVDQSIPESARCDQILEHDGAHSKSVKTGHTPVQCTGRQYRLKPCATLLMPRLQTEPEQPMKRNAPGEEDDTTTALKQSKPVRNVDAMMKVYIFNF